MKAFKDIRENRTEKYEGNYESSDAFTRWMDNNEAKLVDFFDNKFLGDKRTLQEIKEKRGKLKGRDISREERNIWHDENIKPMVTSQLVRGVITGPLKAINETVEFADDIYDYFALSLIHI